MITLLLTIAMDILLVGTVLVATATIVLEQWRVRLPRPTLRPSQRPIVVGRAPSRRFARVRRAV